MAKTIIVGSNKGGTAKSTTSVNLAVELSKNYDVCLVDADKQRTSAKWYERRIENGITSDQLTLIELNGNITETIRNIERKYDFILVDVKGSNSRELITGLLAADLLISPHQCTTADMETLEELEIQIEHVKDLNPTLQAFTYHTVCSTNYKIAELERQEFLCFANEFDQFKQLDSMTYHRKIYRDCIAFGKNVTELDHKSKAVTEINSLVSEIKTILGL